MAKPSPPWLARRLTRLSGRCDLPAVRRCSVLVVMASMRGVPVPIVDIVGVAVVRYRDVPAALAVLVVVTRMLGVAGGLALVGVAVMDLVEVPVVDVVGVAVVGHGDVAAALAMGVVMAGVLGVRWSAHEMFSSWSAAGSRVCRMASVTMWATCSSVSE
jgi:hypothetical protein